MAAVDYYKGLFAHVQTSNYEDILSHIPTLLTDEDNLMLTQLPTELEVKQAVWSLDP